MRDIYNRKIDYLRISITDRCNLRCIYCMPQGEANFIEHEEILTHNEILRLSNIASQLGVRKIKITGGEPLIRKGVIDLIRDIKNIDLIKEVTLTTNGVLLEKYLDELKLIGIDGINISLDAVEDRKFKEITGFDYSSKVISAIKKSAKIGIKTKVNSLIIPQINIEEIYNLVEIARDNKVHLRFIEVMPIGFGRNMTRFSSEDVKELISKKYSQLIPYDKKLGNGPAKYYELDGFLGKIGFISAVSDCFCSECNRVRLTSTGFLKACLQYNYGIELKPLLRENYSDDDIKFAMSKIIFSKPKQHQFVDEKSQFVKELTPTMDCGFNPKVFKRIKELIKNEEIIEEKNMSSIGG